MLEALKALDRPITVVSDSIYVINCFPRQVVRPLAGERVAQLEEAAGGQRRPVEAAGRARPRRWRRVPVGQGPQRRPPERPRRPARGGGGPALTQGRDGPLEVGDDVVAVLEADRDAHQAGRDADRSLLVGRRPTWVLVAGWHTSVSGPPSDVAERAMRTRRASCGRRRSRRRDRWRGRSAGTSAAGRQRVLRVVGQTGIIHGGDAGCGREPSATRRATAAWWRCRTASVRMPRSPLGRRTARRRPCSTL